MTIHTIGILETTELLNRGDASARYTRCTLHIHALRHKDDDISEHDRCAPISTFARARTVMRNSLAKFLSITSRTRVTSYEWEAASFRCKSSDYVGMQMHKLSRLSRFASCDAILTYARRDNEARHVTSHGTRSHPRSRRTRAAAKFNRIELAGPTRARTTHATTRQLRH